MVAKEIVRSYAQDRIDEINSGLFIVDITISSNNDILVELDKVSGGVSIDDCIRVSRNIEHNLDREEEDFQLQVSSAGMDKPLRVEKQFQKTIGKPVKVILKKHGSVEGTLSAYNDQEITITTETKEKIEGSKKKKLVIKNHNISLVDVKETKRVITFK